jgi:hypothetical protein
MPIMHLQPTRIQQWLSALCRAMNVHKGTLRWARDAATAQDTWLSLLTHSRTLAILVMCARGDNHRRADMEAVHVNGQLSTDSVPAYLLQQAEKQPAAQQHGSYAGIRV